MNFWAWIHAVCFQFSAFDVILLGPLSVPFVSCTQLNELLSSPSQVLPTQLVPDDKGQYLRVRMIQKEGKKLFDPVYLFDEGSTINWIPCGRKLTCSFPGATADRRSCDPSLPANRDIPLWFLLSSVTQPVTSAALDTLQSRAVVRVFDLSVNQHHQRSHRILPRSQSV